MRLLDRYLLRELLVPLGYCLGGFLLLWVALDLFTELNSFQRLHLRAGDIVEYYLVKTPEFLVFVFPIGLLLALLYSLTNHARHHEITAIRAAGVSLWRLCLPYLGVGFSSSLALFALNEFWVPISADAAEQIRNRRSPPSVEAVGHDKVLNAVVTNSRANRLWHIGVFEVKTGAMTRPQVISTFPDGSQTILDAERAVYQGSVWTFYHVRERRQTAATNSWPVVVLETNVLARSDFSETPDQINSDIRISASLSSLSLKGAKKADLPVREILNYLRLNPHPPQGAALLYTKLHGRLAAPWTCLVVVLIAIPFGAASGRRNVFVGVASSLFIFLIYYGLQLICPALGASEMFQSSWAPWLAAWFPNIAFGITGLWLTANVR